ncbi:MAG: folylpolyglutamate synthase/dihydrofolate synthase family protein, partial [Gemmatimonadaceae bacterium]
MDIGLSEYGRTLAALFARTGATSKFGLERTEAFLALLGNPHDQIRTFHVAGTNGKGSVVATLYTLLRAKGLRVGRYTSPHLIDFRERIVVDDVEIGEQEVVDFLVRWLPDTERLGATFFEITTAMAFAHFAKAKVDVAIIEAGLGGRLDASNVITPLVAAVTSIGVDHTEFLGDTIPSIAGEKAGIFKAGVPAVFGPMSAEARDTLLSTAAAVGAAPVIQSSDLFAPTNVMVAPTGTDFDIAFDGAGARLRSGLVGAEQAVNSCIALTILGAAGREYETSLAEAAVTLPSVHLPGRFQQVGKFILDVAHNPDSMAALVRTLQAVDPPRPLVAILGILNDKNWRAMMHILAEVADLIILTDPPSAPATRAWSLSEATEFARS